MANILLADDDQMLLDLYKLKFTKAGHKLFTAQDAGEVLEQLKILKPDVLLLDRRLGDSDGLELLGQIRQTENGKTVPAIILTNMDPSLEDYAKVKQHSPAEYLIKEKTDLNDLVKKVSGLAKQ